jgi:hypothetical protein
LIGLTGLAVLALLAPSAWLTLWRGGVRLLAALAPVLALARVARGVNRKATETEFARWFQPIDDAEAPRE